MNKALILIAVLMLNGCTQWKKLTGDDPKPENNETDIRGYWFGQLNYTGTPEHFAIHIDQNGATILDESFMFSHTQIFNGQISGTIQGNVVTLTGDEGSQCPNKWTFSGQAVNNTLVLSINGDGNNLPGVDCWQNPMHENFVMGR